MKELMNFRKDEIILKQEKVLDACGSSDEDGKATKSKSYDVDDAYEVVESIDNKMTQIANVLRGVDKRMSYNLRLISTVMAFNDAEQTQPDSQQEQELHELVQPKTVIERKERILPRLKEMELWITNRFEMNNEQG